MVSISAALFLILVTINYPNTFTVAIALIFIGLGMGFTLGTPLNYMMLSNTLLTESNSALATLSLIRSIGTTIAPSIMIAFVACSGQNVQTNVRELLPTQVTAPALVYGEDITNSLNTIKQDPKYQSFKFPDFSEPKVIEINMTSSENTMISQDLINNMKNADITTITSDSKQFATAMFDQMTPSIITNIQSGVQSGIDAMNTVLSGMNMGLLSINSKITQLNVIYSSLESLPEDTFGTRDLTELVPANIIADTPTSTLYLLDGLKTLPEPTKCH